MVPVFSWCFVAILGTRILPVGEWSLESSPPDSPQGSYLPHVQKVKMSYLLKCPCNFWPMVTLAQSPKLGNELKARWSGCLIAPLSSALSTAYLSVLTQEYHGPESLRRHGCVTSLQSHLTL